MTLNIKKYDKFCAMILPTGLRYRIGISLDEENFCKTLTEADNRTELDKFKGLKNVYTFTLNHDKLEQYPFVVNGHITHKALFEYLAKELDTKDIIVGVLNGNGNNEWASDVEDYTTFSKKKLNENLPVNWLRRTKVRYIVLCDRLPLEESFKDDEELVNKIKESLNKQKLYDIYEKFCKPSIENVMCNINRKYCHDYDKDTIDCYKLVHLEDDSSSNIYLDVDFSNLKEKMEKEIKEEIKNIIKKKLDLQEFDKLGLKLNYEMDISNIDLRAYIDITNTIK